MAKPQRQRIEPPERWEQLEVLFTSREQRTYELIRPVVLFGVPPEERASETGSSTRTIYRHTQHFAEQGMAGLRPVPPAPHPKRVPEEIRTTLAALKAEHPPLNFRELANICLIRFKRSISHKTVQRILHDTPAPAGVTRRYPRFQEMEPSARRLAIIQLHADGWNAKSIATYLDTSRQTVHLTLKRWVDERFLGLPNKSRAPKRPFRKVTLRTMLKVRRLSRNPAIGAWRVHAALKQEGIRLSPRTCSRLLALHRELYQQPRPVPTPPTPRPMPFRAGYRHQYWSVDMRYIDHQLGEGQIYTITILENYSRAVLASAISRTQNLTAYLMVLFTAIRMYGAPDGLVSDGGAVFKARQALEIYHRLGIVKHQIERGQAWQNYCETLLYVIWNGGCGRIDHAGKHANRTGGTGNVYASSSRHGRHRMVSLSTGSRPSICPSVALERNAAWSRI